MNAQEIIEQIQREWATFKVSNEERFAEIKRYGAASQETEAKVDRANGAITALQSKLQETQEAQAARLLEIEDRLNRPQAAGTDWRKVDEGQLRLYAGWQATVRGLARGEELDLIKVDLPFIRNYQKAYRNWMRRGEQAPAEDLRLLNEMSVGSNPDGGYWVEPDTTGRVVQFVNETSPMRKYADVQPISSDSLEGSYDLGDAGYGWVGETEARPETTTPGIGQWKIDVRELYANPRTTQRVLDDAMQDPAAWLLGKVSDIFLRGENTAFVTGNTPLRPRGFTTYTAGTPAGTSVAAYRVIQQVASGAAATLTTPGLIDLLYSLKPEFVNGSVLAMNRSTEAAIRKLATGTGDLYWMPDFAEKGASTINGVPVVQFADMANVGAAALPIAYGNFKRGYQIVDRLGIRTLRDPYTDKPYVHFYSTKRVGGDVIDFDAIKLQVVSAS